MTFDTIPYKPVDPKHYYPKIAVIGCGGISERHLAAYQHAGYHVAALVDLDLDKARARQTAFFPNATVSQSYEDVLADASIEVVDITTHPRDRVALIEAALYAGKHVLSQKPFVLDLAAGRRLVELAERQGVKLAVNQNGRWAPHFSYIRQAVDTGLLGSLKSATFTLQFDHNWTKDTPFNDVHHLILYDYATHWFDFIHTLFKIPATQVYATIAHSKMQQATPPLLAHVTISYPNCLVSLTINGDTTTGSLDQTQLIGSKASLVSQGPDLNTQTVTVTTPEQLYTPNLTGHWMLTGFHGTMAELLCAVEEGRTPHHNARDNLASLALCFAALKSADTGQVVCPGDIEHFEATS